MKGLSGRGYKGGDDLAITVERELAFNTPRDCYIITLQSIKNIGTKPYTRAKRRLCNGTLSNVLKI